MLATLALLDFAQLAHLLVNALVAQGAVFREQAVDAHIIAGNLLGKLRQGVALDAQAVVANERANRLDAKYQRVDAALGKPSQLLIKFFLGDGERLLKGFTGQLVCQQGRAANGG